MSQTGSSDLLYKLDQEPALRYAITGDQSVIITPTVLPPSLKSVEEWNKGRLLYKQLKNEKQIIGKEENLKTDENDKNKPAQNIVKVDQEKYTDPGKNDIRFTEAKKTKEVKKRFRLNLFTGKRELVEVEDSDSQKSSQEVQNSQKEEACRDASESGSQEKDNCSETPDDVLHSTPVMRRQSTELFVTECTPIADSPGESSSQEGEEPARSQEEGPAGFITPKRIRPLRRLSTNTDSALRRAILTTQIKVS